ncbi:Crossover junction endonuclease mus81, partial [Tulasnella sp. 427]
MPPRNVCVNPELLAVTEHLKNECESDNMKRTWNKCIKSLKGHQTVITEKDDLRALHGWGHYTSGEVWKRYAGVIQGFPLDEAPGPSRSRPKKTPSNSRSSSTKVSPTKRALEETVEDFSSLMDMAAPLPKRARPTATTYTMTEAAPSISAVPQSAHPVPPTLNPNDPRQLEGFGFCYLDERNRRVKSSDEAYISVLGGEAVFKVEFSALQASHRWAMTFIGQSQTNGNGLCVGFVSQVVAEVLTQCPGIQIQPPQPSRIVPAPSKLNPVPLKQRASTLGGPSNSLLQAEFSKAKRKNNSLDPTRMLSDKNAAALADIRSARAFPGSSTRHMGSETTKEISPRATQTEHRSSPVNASLSRSSTTLPTIPIQAPLKCNATLPDETPSVPARRAAPRASNHIPAPRPLDDLELELEDSQYRLTQTSQTLPSSPTGSDANDTIYSSAPAPNYLQPFQPHILPARSYNISMVLDIREGRQGNETLIPDLEARGVNIERRPLAIGDVAWIATKAYVDGLGGPQECVLDFIVERKRMDDLITSVKDGRFHEQK